MSSGNLRRRLAPVAAALIAGALLVPAAASAQQRGVLSPELAKLATPAVRAQALSAQADAVDLPAEGPGSLQREGTAVRVEISFAGGAVEAIPALEAAGASVEHSSAAYQLVSAVVPPADLAAVSGVPGVTAVDAVRQPILAATTAGTSGSNPAICEGGSVLSEGINQLGVVGVGAEGEPLGAREKYGVRGAGETVGVLSDSFNIGGGAAGDVISDDLPGVETSCSGQATPVNVLEEGPTEEVSDEGRAMLQIIHDIAPHANLAFATGYTGELAMAQNIERLAAPVVAGGAGADVIVDDLSYFEEPMFQEGPIAVAVAKVTAQGVTYLSSAGNNSDNISGRESGIIRLEGEEGVGTKGVKPTTSWETSQFRGAEKEYCPIPVGAAARHCLDFNPEPGVEDNKFGFKIHVGEPVTVVLGWAEPWYGVKADLDLYLLRRTGTPEGQSSNPETKEVEEEVLESPIIEEKGGKRIIKRPNEELPNGETEVVAKSEIGNIGGKPVEFLNWSGNTEVEPESGEAPGPQPQEQLYLVVNRCFSNLCDPSASPTAIPRLKLIFLENGLPIISTEYRKSTGGDVVGPTIFGHNGAASAVTTGAVRFYREPAEQLPEDEPFEHPGILERFSSHGPVTNYYAPVTSKTPAAALGAPETVKKPDVVATQCTANTFFGGFFLGFHRFCGTSASAPHAAGVAAIAHQASPGKTPAQIKAALKSTTDPKPVITLDFGEATEDEAGAGLLRAVQAIEALGGKAANDPASVLVTPVRPIPPPEPTPTPEPTPPPVIPAPGGGATGGERRESGNGNGKSQAPKVTIKKHPPKLMKSKAGRAKVTFKFKADQKGAKFECSIDKAKWKKCGATYKPLLLLGAHELRVRARGTDLAIGPAVTYKFTIKLTL